MSTVTKHLEPAIIPFSQRDTFELACAHWIFSHHQSMIEEAQSEHFWLLWPQRSARMSTQEESSAQSDKLLEGHQWERSWESRIVHLVCTL